MRTLNTQEIQAISGGLCGPGMLDGLIEGAFIVFGVGVAVAFGIGIACGIVLTSE
jgi:hypothetical protein